MISYLLKRHLKLNHTFMQIYTLPLALFWYFQAIIMGAITIYNLTSGYITYFVSKGVWISLGVSYFFFEWFSIVGIIHWFITKNLHSYQSKPSTFPFME